MADRSLECIITPSDPIVFSADARNEYREKEKFYITIKVDGLNGNESFSYEKLGDWYDCYVERYEDFDNNANSYVRLCVIATENFLTESKYGTITIKHNRDTNISVEVQLEQEASKYDITAEYDGSGWVYDKFPDPYQEKKLIVKATGGSGNWHVREIKQYMVEPSDAFDDKNIPYDEYNEQQQELISQDEVAYDGVFTWKKNGDELIIRSYGKIEMCETHMRYYVVLAHDDFNNANERYNNAHGTVKKLFIFDY